MTRLLYVLSPAKNMELSPVKLGLEESMPVLGMHVKDIVSCLCGLSVKEEAHVCALDPSLAREKCCKAEGIVQVQWCDCKDELWKAIGATSSCCIVISCCLSDYRALKWSMIALLRASKRQYLHTMDQRIEVVLQSCTFLLLLNSNSLDQHWMLAR